MQLREPQGPVRLRIAAAGDVALIGGARARARSGGYDAALAALAPAFRAADLGFVNLEMPIADPAWVRPGRSSEFWQDAEVAPALVRAGVHVVSLANNHILDCGPEGLARTLEACAAANLATVGAGADLDRAREPARLERHGSRVVLLAYGAARELAAAPGRPGIAPLELELVREDLARWRGEAEALVVSVHWGSMYVEYPPPRVLELGDALIAAGADLVLGHHPHVTQGYRIAGRSLTLFSLGDACFDPRAGDFEAAIAAEARRDTGVFTACLAERSGLELWPLRLDDDGLPAAASSADAERIAARLERLSAGLADGGERFRSESAPQLLRYELQSFGHYLRSGQLARAARLLGTLRPRHLPVLWQALRRLGRAA